MTPPEKIAEYKLKAQENKDLLLLECLQEIEDLQNIVDSAKSALGEHPDAEINIGDEIGLLRDGERHLWEENGRLNEENRKLKRENKKLQETLDDIDNDGSHRI